MTYYVSSGNSLADPGFSFGGQVGRRNASIDGLGFGEGWTPPMGVHNARFNKVKACKKLSYRQQTVQSRHHTKK